MDQEEFLKLANVNTEKKRWLCIVKDVCISHMKWTESQDELTHDDEGLLELERAYLYLYGLAELHGILGEKQ